MAVLLHDGPNWAAMLVIVLLLLRGMGKQFRTFLDVQSWSRDYATKALEALDKFSATIIQNQALIMAEIKDTRRANDDIVINAIREMGTSSSDSTGRILLALGHREELTVMAIEGLARAIRDDLAALRAPPPPGGVGSQVKDGGKQL